MKSEWHLLLTGLAALGMVLGLIWAGARLARLSGFAPPATRTRLLMLRDTLALDSRRRLLLVRCAGQDVLLLTGGGQDVVVGWLPAPPGVVAEKEPEP